MKKTQMTMNIVLQIGLLASLVTAPGCCNNDALCLEDWQRDLLSGLIFLADDVLDDDPGTLVNLILGRSQPGLSCWDLNGNYVEDPEEDINGDGVFDALDCQGPAGEDGEDADSGRTADPGEDGAPGLSCWDLNGNYIQDPEEDINGDGVFDALDCQGADGTDGTDGKDGADGDKGETGDPGPTLFDVFIDSFFTTISNTGDPSIDVIETAVFPQISGVNDQSGEYSRVAYRVAIPSIYGSDNPVTMRLFLLRVGPEPDGCFVFRLDARRMRSGSGVEVYGEPRWIRVELPTSGITEEGTYLVVDLPLNVGSETTVPQTGLGFQTDPQGDLAAGHFLGFELNAQAGGGSVPWLNDGGDYYLMGVEFFESETATVNGATVFFSEGDITCGTNGTIEE